MKRAYALLTLTILICTVGLVMAQQDAGEDEEPPPRMSFEIEAEVGRALPRKIVYDPVFERYAVVDALNRLMFIDALTYETEHVLYETGQYNDFTFSHDGRWLGLAINDRIELWDAESGELVSRIADAGAALRVVGPVAFSRDDNLLQFEGVYPAPQALRRTENDRIQTPWLWNLTAARNEGNSTFPRQVEAWQFFDYRNGFVLGPNDRVVAGLPGRLQVLDANSLQQQFDIPTDRYERDPLTAWFSAKDDKIYINPNNTNRLVQVDADRGVLVEIPLDEPLSQDDLVLIGDIELSTQARLIGGTGGSALQRRFLGNETTRFDLYGPGQLTTTLVDLIIPPALTGDNIVALLFIFNERSETGFFRLARSGSQMVLSPDDSTLLVRANDNDGEERIWVYDMETGRLIESFIPSLRAIGRYNRASDNRVLAYDSSGKIIISDFQRYDAQSFEVLAEDLRYSRRFDRFFFSEDNTGVVTLSGTEWRLWDVATGTVLRREVLPLRGSIIATSSDGFRFLTRFETTGNLTGVEVVDMTTNERHSQTFAPIPGSSVEQIFPSSDWAHFYVVYSRNNWGQYTPGNQIALYSLEDGIMWHIAGDDLPPPDNRTYGWVDDNTVFVRGNGAIDAQPARIFGRQYDLSGVPSCIVQAFPDQIDTWVMLWERLVLRLRPDTLHNLTGLICADLPTTSAQVEQLLLPTRTPLPITLTPIRIEGVPVCLTQRFPGDAHELGEIWLEITTGLSQEQIAQTVELICEGVEPIPEIFARGQFTTIDQTMMIDIHTGERFSGGFTPQEVTRRPIGPIAAEFERQTERPLGTAILSPNEQFVAASNLPGELIIYRLLTSYETLLAEVAATAAVQLEARNLIGAAPSPTPTFDTIGTARPTVTPTVTPTPIPRPQQRVYDMAELTAICPAEHLYTLDNAPDTYQPTGQIQGPVQGDTLWRLIPSTGERLPDETIPQCGARISCEFSTDRQWILARSEDEVWVVRPDGSDSRLLYGEDDRIPREFGWDGVNSLQHLTQVELVIDGRTRYFDGWQRDILGVFPDPEPWIPGIRINEMDARILSRQPGGPLVLVSVEFSTGVGPGYNYYLANRETGEYVYFARADNGRELTTRWHPQGDRLFYHYNPVPFNSIPIWYQISDADMSTNRLLGVFESGTWSNDGRYVAFTQESRTQPIGVWDSFTGQTSTYCIPQTGARFYSGRFTWSPDNGYIALRTFLPADENVEGIGQHVLILDVETGHIIDLSAGFGQLVVWAKNPGEYGDAS